MALGHGETRQRASVISRSEAAFHHMHLPIASVYYSNAALVSSWFINARKKHSGFVIRNVDIWYKWAERHNQT